MAKDKCGFCEGGTLEKKTLPYYDQPWGNKTYRFENVPAEVCDVCGEIYFDAKTDQAMDEALIAIEEKDREPKRFVKLPVVDCALPTPA